eukprot:s2628_g8.t1
MADKAPGSPVIDESVLPPDAPPGHEAHQKARAARTPIQTTVNAAGGSTSAALRIARALYVKLEEGMAKEAALAFRKDCYEKLMASIKGKQDSIKFLSREYGAGTAKDDKKKKEEVKKTAKEGQADKSKELKKEGKEKKEKKDSKEEKKEELKEGGKEKKDKKDSKEEKKEELKEEKHEKIEKKEEMKDSMLLALLCMDFADEEPKEEPEENDDGPVATAKVTAPTGTSTLRGKVPNLAPESLQSYDPSSAGLSEAALAALPPDATEPEVFDKVKQRRLEQGVIVIDFDGTRMQVTSKPVGDNWYAAFRIARACYVKLRDGMSKEDTLAFRSQCYQQFVEAAGLPVSKPRGTKRKKTERTEKSEKKKKKEKKGKDDKKDKKDKKSKKKKKKKKKATTSSVSSASSSSESDSESETSESETPSEYPWPKQHACAKMLVRSGLRCLCHFQINCPTKMAEVTKKGMSIVPATLD